MRAHADRLWRRAVAPAWMWLLPVVMAAVVWAEPGHIQLALKVLVGGAAVALVARRPQPALLVLVALLPFQELGLAAALRLGIPAGIVRDVGFWKEAVVAGCVVAAVFELLRRGRRLDVLDALCLIYLGIVGLYYLFPGLFVHPTGPLAVGPPTNFTTLSTAVRNDAGFVVLLLAVRRLPLDAGYRRRFLRILFAVGIVVAGVGMFEFVFSKQWNHLVVSSLQVPHYLSSVLHVSVPNPADIRVYTKVGGRNVLRIGSVFLDQLSCGFYLVIALAIGLERIVRGDKRLALLGAVALIGVGIVLTQTRDAVLAAAIVFACTLRATPERRGPLRPRYVFFVAAALVALVPLTVATGLASRVSGGGADESTQLHIQRSEAGAKALIAAPLGRGLGTGATNGTRFSVATTLTSEDYYLQVGNETGAVSMVVFIALVVVIDRRLRRRARARSDILVASWRGLFLGLSLAALLLQVWLDPALAWTVWAGVGICLGAATPVLAPKAAPAPPRLRPYLIAAWQRAPLIVITVAAALLVAHHVANGTARRYRAESSVVVGLPQISGAAGPPDTVQGLIGALDRQRVTDAVALRTVLVEPAVSQAGVARSAVTVAGETSVVVPPKSAVLKIRVTDTDPVVAQVLANKLAQTLVANAAALQQPNRLAQGTTEYFSVALAAPAVAPLTPMSNGIAKALFEAAALAVVAGLLVALLAEYLDIRINEPDDIGRHLDVPVLGTLAPAPRREGLIPQVR